MATGTVTPPTTLFRPLEGRVLAGVCAGFALRYGWDVTIVRLIAALGALLGGTFLVAYVIAWIIMPDGPVVTPPGPTGAV